jgi:hypothetical protein
MINRNVILEGCRAYVQATGPGLAPSDVAEHAQALANGENLRGYAWRSLTGPLMAALAAAVDADRSDWDAVTRQNI